MITEAQRTELIDDLMGTCKSMTGVLATFDLTEDDFIMSDHLAIDHEIFQCDGCGWWCGTEEMNDNPELDGNQVCQDCKGEDDEE